MRAYLFQSKVCKNAISLHVLVNEIGATLANCWAAKSLLLDPLHHLPHRCPFGSRERTSSSVQIGEVVAVAKEVSRPTILVKCHR